MLNMRTLAHVTQQVVAKLERTQYDNAHNTKHVRATMRKGSAIPLMGDKVFGLFLCTCTKIENSVILPHQKCTRI